MEDISTHDIYDCFGIKSPSLLNKKIQTKNDLLNVIQFCICVSLLSTEVDKNLLDEEDDI